MTIVNTLACYGTQNSSGSEMVGITGKLALFKKKVTVIILIIIATILIIIVIIIKFFFL